MERAPRLWLIGYLVVTATNLVAETLHATRPAFVTVFLAMLVLIGFLVSARIRADRLTGWVIAALLWSWLGDWLGDLIAPHVVTKLILFFFGHICFVVAFWPYRRRSVLRRPWVLLAYVLIIGALLTLVAVKAAEIETVLGYAVVAYGALLGLMAATATGLNWLAGIGSIVFVISDLSIGITAFVIPGGLEYGELLIMSTYLVAQLLIVWGALRRQADDASTTEHPSSARVGVTP